ncbi:MAG: CCA tRNA nucleotidyltransferase [Patescibacteria group bacterium]
MISLINQKNKLPKELLDLLTTLNSAGFESYLVGGCIRDLLRDIQPKDWDITTSAIPEEIQNLFPDSFYTNTFGTVGVKTETLGVVEITPFRTESNYSDGRRPDTVTFTKDVQEDLKRRDFTINAIAYNPVTDSLIDLFGGIKDIEASLVKAVGNGEDRFAEDGLRILRMVRFAAQLNFSIDTDTLMAAIAQKDTLKLIAKDRIRDELVKILLSKYASTAFLYMKNMGILSYISKHLEESVNIKQNGCHAYDVFEHLIRSMQCAVDKEYPLEIRLAALFHDIGKPPTRQWSNEKKDYTFYGHEVVGAKITKSILQDLNFSRETIEKTVKLVRWHMFFSDTEQITPSAVRRMIANVGRDNIWDLINLRICDRVGTGRPKEDPYRLRKYMSLIEEVLSDPTDVSMLKVSGNDLIQELSLTPGPIIGKILHVLLEKALVDPTINTKGLLLAEAKNLLTLSPTELETLTEQALEAKKDKEKEVKDIIKKKYKVS